MIKFKDKIEDVLKVGTKGTLEWDDGDIEDFEIIKNYYSDTLGENFIEYKFTLNGKVGAANLQPSFFKKGRVWIVKLDK